MPALETVLENSSQPSGSNATWAKQKDVPPAPQPVQGGQQQINPGQGQVNFAQRKDSGYPSRINARYQMNNDTKPGVYPDNAYSVAQTATTLLNPTAGTSRPRFTLRDQVVVRLGPMTPLWLSGEGLKNRLVVARRVRITSRLVEQLALLSAWPEAAAPASLAVLALNRCSQAKLPQPREVCQGIVLDWPRLQHLLADEVRDLFPAASLVPMRDERPPHPERTMTALPVELDPGEGPARVVLAPQPEPGPCPPPPLAESPLGWTPLRMGLGLAWAAALVALAAVGLGGWSLLNLSERRIRFVSAVTHELRTPLTTLRLYLDMLTGGMVKEEGQKAEYLQTLNAETERLNRLVGNVLAFSRLENQRPRLVQTETTVGELLAEIRSTWYGRCHDAEKDLVVEGGDDTVLVTDVQMVQQILGNLIDNACKYSRGAEDRHIWVRALLRGPRLVLEVEDRGPGVPKGERNSIFRAFCRGQSADVTAGGVGLGLALAERWARLLGGTLTLCNAPQRVGACFRLELPLGVCGEVADQ
jgi:signal transduction histidine kinase